MLGEYHFGAVNSISLALEGIGDTELERAYNNGDGITLKNNIFKKESGKIYCSLFIVYVKWRLSTVSGLER